MEKPVWKPYRTIPSYLLDGRPVLLTCTGKLSGAFVGKWSEEYGWVTIDNSDFSFHEWLPTHYAELEEVPTEE